jgi:DNA polymerase III delta prime subunit
VDGTVSTQEIRTLLDGMYFAPTEGVCRVFLFDNADKFKPQVQNVLLKAIEEPPAGNAFIFIAQSPESLLQTLRSRCLALRTDYTKLPEDSEDKAVEDFATAALRGDGKGMMISAATAENAAKEEKREAFGRFLKKLSDIMNREIKNAALSGDDQKLKRAAAIKEVTDGIVSKTAAANVNINLWLSYLIAKINQI